MIDFLFGARHSKKRRAKWGAYNQEGELLATHRQKNTLEKFYPEWDGYEVREIKQ